MELRPLPQPEITEETRPFWEGCAAGELRVQRCTSCGALRWYPRPMCPECASLEVEWVATSGRGRVLTWTVIHHVFNPTFEGRVPYAAVIVELEEGARFVTNVLDCEPEELREGLEVEAVFVEVDGTTFPYFRRR